MAAEGLLDRCVGLRERQRLRREAAILEAAFVLIAEKGYDAMTMDELAERAAISKPTLYHHFSSKEAIAVRALVQLNEGVVEAIRAIDTDLAPVDRLRTVLRWMVRNRFSPTPAAFLRARPSLTPARSHPDYLHAVSRRLDAIAEIIADAQRDGDLDPSIPSRLLAQMFFNLVCSPEYDDLIADHDASAVDVEHAILTLVFSGVRAERT